MSKIIQKEKNLSSTCHCEGISPWQSNEIASHSFAMMEQHGRSMVEMLGVLAIVGVLSVTGVSGYTSAMNKHRANELLNEASKRATVVAAQAMQGRETFSINEFPNNEALKFSTEVTHDKTNTQFTLEITEVDEAVCQQMQKNIGALVRKFEPKTCSGDNNTVKLTFNDDMSATPKASDYDGNSSACGNAGKKYCTGSNTCVDTGANCTCSGTTPTCKVCDTDTGSYTNAADNTPCVTAGNEDGTCQSGSCVVTPSCATSGQCTSNATVCPGYYCSIAGGTTDNGEVCGTSKYTPEAGTVKSLGTPREPKTGYLSSPSYVASWDAAVNYCKALKSTIAQGVTVNGVNYAVNYSDYDSLSNGLASLPSGCSVGSSCSALPDDDYYWLDGLVQWDCDFENYSTTYGSNSCSAFVVYNGLVNSNSRGDSFNYALCE